MQDRTTEPLSFPVDSSKDVLTEILRDGARKMLIQAIDAEVSDWIEDHVHLVDSDGHRQVVRNGHLPERQILTGLGSMGVRQPRVHDRRPEGSRVRFHSKILPPYLRKSKTIDELIPWLYLKGISTGDMAEALEALVGPNAKGLSAKSIERLKNVWQDEYKEFSHRSLEDKQFVYVWADGVYFNVRLEDPANKRQCILVLMGATHDGKKELLAITDGYRESKQSWLELLRDCEHRGLKHIPNLAVGDGALGFWAAIEEFWPTTEHQRCWCHKTANVLNYMPKSLHGKAKPMLHEIWMAKTRKEAEVAFDHFLATFDAKYPKATACLVKDRKKLLAFYDYPAEHWTHVRTTNPIESVFATVRLRTDKTKGCGSRIACLAMVFKLVQSASKKWRALNGSALLPQIIRGVKFVDGEAKVAA
jgi:transposase-like protein